MTTRPNTTLLSSWMKRSLRDAAWAPSLVFGIHVVALDVLNLYTLFPYFDVPMHLLGGIAMAFFFHRASLNASRLGIIGPYQAVVHRLLVFTSTCTIAVVWEFAEFVGDRCFGTHSQGGVGDTMGDLFFGVAGAIIFIVAAAIRARSPNALFSLSPGRVKESDATIPES
jgi:hypothetical protein